MFNIRTDYPSDYICSVDHVEMIKNLNLNLVEI